MARIIDTQPPAHGRREPIIDPLARIVSEPVAEPMDEETTDVPFIEVGGPVKSSALKTNRSASPIPTIIPLVRNASHDRPQTKAPTPSEPAIFHISFQPLPFAESPAEPIDQRLAREFVAYHQPDHPVSQEYGAFLHELTTQLGTEPGKTLLFTSAVPGAGVTSVMLNLGLTAVRNSSQRVLLIDANFARPALAQRLGLAAAPGLRDVLAQTIPFTWAMQETGVPNLQFMANGRPDFPEAMEQWPVVIAQMQQHFDWVLIDGAEWGHHELPGIAAPCLATYLVLRPADLASSEINDTLHEIQRHGGHLRGYVVVQR